MLNHGVTQSQSRQPRALIKINDIVVRKIDNIEYIENNYYQPDAFRVTLPLYNNDPRLTVEYWQSQPAILVEILIGFPNDPINYGVSDLQSLIIGGINDLTIRPFDGGGGFIDFNGFDLSKKLIDTKTTEKYPNQTSSQIAITLANLNGLTPVVTPTTTNAGFYYNQDYVQLGNETTQWDLLTYLAQQEGFQVFVRGQSLYFQPRPAESKTPYLFKCENFGTGNVTFNATRFTMSRNFNYAQDVIVNVKSWNAKTGTVSAQVKGSPVKKGLRSPVASPLPQSQIFSYTIPGLSKQQCIERAQQILADVSIHERIIDVTAPGDNLLRKDSIIKLQGISTSSDQTYYPDTITRTMSPNGSGYQMSFRAKNHSPQSVVTL